MVRCYYCKKEMNENPHSGFCDECRGKLGEDAHNVMLGALDGKVFLYTGMKDENLPYTHTYRLGNIDYGKCTLIIEDKTDDRVLDVPLDKLNFFREFK